VVRSEPGDRLLVQQAKAGRIPPVGKVCESKFGINAVRVLRVQRGTGDLDRVGEGVGSVGVASQALKEPRPGGVQPTDLLVRETQNPTFGAEGLIKMLCGNFKAALQGDHVEWQADPKGTTLRDGSVPAATGGLRQPAPQRTQSLQAGPWR
jgi:hypothetical protein